MTMMGVPYISLAMEACFLLFNQFIKVNVLNIIISTNYRVAEYSLKTIDNTTNNANQ